MLDEILASARACRRCEHFLPHGCRPVLHATASARLLLVGQAMGVMYFSVGLVFLLGLVFWAIDAALLWLGSRAFRRAEVIAQL